jgi:large subunit ribosomal protein L6
MLIGNSIGYKTYLNLVGLGYSIELKEKNKLLLKLGYSHKVEINIPKTLNLIILKRSLKLFGVNLVEVNHFAKLLQDLKYPDIYKGKGLYTYKQNMVLKEGKKRKR